MFCPLTLFHILRKIFCRVFTSLPSMRQCMSCHSPTTFVPLYNSRQRSCHLYRRFVRRWLQSFGDHGWTLHVPMGISSVYIHKSRYPYCVSFEVLLSERLIVGSISETIIECPYLDTFLDFLAKQIKRSPAILSFLKLKYSKCTLCLACRIAWNISSNFSWPLIRSVTELSWEKRMPFPRSWFTINESLVCALHSEQDSHNVAMNNKYLILLINNL